MEGPNQQLSGFLVEIYIEFIYVILNSLDTSYLSFTCSNLSEDPRLHSLMDIMTDHWGHLLPEQPSPPPTVPMPAPTATAPAIAAPVEAAEVVSAPAEVVSAPLGEIAEGVSAPAGDWRMEEERESIM